jgi:hypothetical protein
MSLKTKTLQHSLLRLLAILLHALLNFIAISYLTDLDITGSWLLFAGVVLVVLVLLYLFLKHVFSFILFLKSR